MLPRFQRTRSQTARDSHDAQHVIATYARDHIATTADRDIGVALARTQSANESAARLAAQEEAATIAAADAAVHQELRTVLLQVGELQENLSVEGPLEGDRLRPS